MATVTLMRCTVPHWQGDSFIDSGTVVPKGDGRVIPEFFEAVEYPDVDAPTPKKSTKST